MAGTIEIYQCSICKKVGPVNRKYYMYRIKCECHSPWHFELVYHCTDCIPVEPKQTRVLFDTSKIIKFSES